MTFAPNPGASEEDLAAFRAETGLQLPSDYVDYLKRSNGGEGFIGNEYLMLWKLQELAPFNRDYEVSRYVPDLLMFGSNGGGDAYAFRTRTTPWQIVRVPFVGMSPSLCEFVAPSFSEFLKCLEPT